MRPHCLGSRRQSVYYPTETTYAYQPCLLPARKVVDDRSPNVTGVNTSELMYNNIKKSVQMLGLLMSTIMPTLLLRYTAVQAPVCKYNAFVVHALTRNSPTCLPGMGNTCGWREFHSILTTRLAGGSHSTLTIRNIA